MIKTFKYILPLIVMAATSISVPKPASADPAFSLQTTAGSITCPAEQHGFNLLIFGSSRVSDEPGEFCKRFAEFLMVSQNVSELRNFIATLPVDTRIIYEEAIARWLAQRLGIPLPTQVKVSHEEQFSNFWLTSDQALMRRTLEGLREQDLRLQRLRQLEIRHPEYRDAIRLRPIPTANDVQNRIDAEHQEQQRRLDEARSLTNQLIPQLRWGQQGSGGAQAGGSN